MHEFAAIRDATAGTHGARVACMRLHCVVFVLAACGSDDVPASDECVPFSVEFLSPVDGATDVPRMLVTRILWSSRPAERFDTLSDVTNTYQSTGEEVEPDGTIVTHWETLPANTLFSLSLSWDCVSFANNCAPVEVALGQISFTTGAN